MGLEEIKGKIGDLTEKGKDALKGDKAESVSDSVLDGAANLANKVTGGKFEDEIEDVRKNLDDKIGE